MTLDYSFRINVNVSLKRPLYCSHGDTKLILYFSLYFGRSRQRNGIFRQIQIEKPHHKRPSIGEQLVTFGEFKLDKRMPIMHKVTASDRHQPSCDVLERDMVNEKG